MTDPTKNTNPEVSAEIAGIGYLSPRGEELKEVARMELGFVREHIQGYTENERIFILDVLSRDILGHLLDNDI
ncbi:hypothetical protein [Phocaeicola coprocola]|jgi:hypothetical protein